ncbi:hypothetical protein SERLA73DRAFT_70183 [Serpula lacrymans var. lacrymans S7.3]|uniref:Retrotransposon gag domain-containing protein n=1 Tax=Serpula lacrymans var. lacrymans (strain S7.3) TaxID=936435 RepID=F8PM65_SERL3|nr:hypothetical protein SERLA73DRAFT_70183 [Serpula lacrymans var. lacrymans S7.3]
MLSQPDMNSLLHNMRAQIQALTNQLAKIQATPAAEFTVEQKFNKKVKIVADPGTFEGDRAQFAEWWIKLQIWIKANWDAFADDFEIATAVLSRLKGPVAGRYTQVRMQECHTARVWPTWDDLKVEIKKYFKLQAERDWARQQIWSFKQGNMRTDDFVTRFLALSIQGGLGNEHAVDIGAVQGGQMQTRCRPPNKKNNQGHQACQLETEKLDDWLQTLAGCSYDKIRVFFYDQQAAEMKAQGKKFGA